MDEEMQMEAAAMAEAEPEMMEAVTISMPREAFEMAKEFVSVFSKTLDAVDKKINADIKAEEAAGNLEENMMSAEVSPTGLEGFGQELSAMSDNQLGLPI